MYEALSTQQQELTHKGEFLGDACRVHSRKDNLVRCLAPLDHENLDRQAPLKHEKQAPRQAPLMLERSWATSSQAREASSSQA